MNKKANDSKATTFEISPISISFAVTKGADTNGTYLRRIRGQANTRLENR